MAKRLGFSELTPTLSLKRIPTELLFETPLNIQVFPKVNNLVKETLEILPQNPDAAEVFDLAAKQPEVLAAGELTLNKQAAPIVSPKTLERLLEYEHSAQKTRGELSSVQ